MTPLLAALSGPISTAGVLIVTTIGAAALVVGHERLRGILALTALALAPGLLILDLSDSPQLSFIHSSPLSAIGLGVVGLGVIAGLALVLQKSSRAFPILVALALPFRLPIQVGGDTANLLLPLYLVVAAGAVAWAVPLVVGRVEDEKRRATLLDWALAGWLLLYGLGSIWSNDPSKAVQQAVFFYIPFSILYLLIIRVKWTPQLIRGCAMVLVGLALVFSALAFYEFSTETLLLNPKLLISNQFHTYFRVNSVFFDPNIFGRFLMLVMVGLSATLLDTRRGRNVAALAGCIAVLLAAMVMTLSQSSLVGLLAGLAVIAALRWSWWKVGVITLAVTAIGVTAVVVAPGKNGIKVHSLRVLNNESSGHANLVSGGIDLFTARPLAGWGSGSFSKAYRHEQKAGAPTAVSASHTTPVTAAAEEGILGLIAYLLVLVAGFLRVAQGARRSTARTAATAGLAALVVHSMTYAAFFEDPSMWVILALGVALPIPLTREQRRAEREARRSDGDDPDLAAQPIPVT
ncbi:MAG: O-antigen ligase family protein [Actinomycetes bacterium]